MDESAWKVLKMTPRKLDRSRYRHFPASTPSGRPLKNACRTGYSPREAEERLLAAGRPLEDTRRRVGEAVRAHAAAVARSWTPWVERYGFIDEMFRLPPETLEEFLHQQGWDDLRERVIRVAADTGLLESDPALRKDLSNRVTGLAGEDAPRPAAFMLQHLHGLPPGLAEAAALRHRYVVPGVPEAIVFLMFFIPILAVAFLASLIGGHARTFLPIIFAWAFTFLVALLVANLVREEPFRRAPWRKRLARWKAETAASAAEQGGGSMGDRGSAGK
ncbi:MAG: hypothetical protein KA419_12685 [Acidobacteria bacterium]|nr:hypothetical protein [Acidobacteriota bacterium]